MSVWNWSGVVSDYSESYFYEKYSMNFKNLVWLNAGTTLLVVLAVPVIPKYLMDRREP